MELERLACALGDRLREERERRGLSGLQVAARLGVPVRTYYRWERGCQEKVHAGALRLCQLWDIDIRRLA